LDPVAVPLGRQRVAFAIALPKQPLSVFFAAGLAFRQTPVLQRH
jgi:hypothetical protein